MQFFKYHSNGNDFIIIDNRKNAIALSQKNIEDLCHRRFLIGGDGVVFLQNSNKSDYKMQIFNSDGLEADMCGNALLSLTKFLYDFIEKKKAFQIETKSFIYQTFMEDGFFSFYAPMPKFLKKNVIFSLDNLNLAFDVIDSGVHHGVIFTSDIDNIQVFEIGKKIRNLKQVKPGINVNFCEVLSDNKIKVRVYEKGVENETLCCATGALAIAFAHFSKKSIKGPLHLFYKGGIVRVLLEKDWLKIFTKPEFAFTGFIESFTCVSQF